MKESTLLEMKNKIQSLTNIVQVLLNEMDHIRTLSIGTMETIKHMPGYEDALSILKEQSEKEKSNGDKQQDTK